MSLTSPHRTKLLTLTVAAVAVVLRLFYLFQLHHSPLLFLGSMDTDYYLAVAGRILRGEWLGHDVYFQSGFLYPYVLALFRLIFGPSLLPVQLAQVLFDGVGAALVALCADRYFGQRAAWVAGLGYALYAPFIAGSVQPLIDLPVLVPLLLGILLLGSAGARAATGGTLMGFVAVTRPYLLPLLPLIATAPFIGGARGKSWLRLALPPLIGMVLVVALVAVRNRVVGHEWVLSSAGGGFVFYVGNNPEASGGFYVPTTLGVVNDPFGYAESTRVYPSRQLGHQVTWGEASTFWFHKGLSFWKEEPGAALRGTLAKARLCFNNDEIGDNYDFDYLKRHLSFLHLPLLSFGIILPFGLLGMFLAVRRWRELLYPYSIALFVVFSQIAILVYTRHRYILAAILLLFGGAAVDALLTWGVKRQWGRLMSAGMFLVAIGTLSFQPSGVPHRPWESSRNLAVALRVAGREAEAGQFFAEALRLNYNDTDAAGDYAELLTDQGDVVGARATIVAMLDRVSMFPKGHLLMRDLAAGAPPAGLATEFNRSRAGVIPVEESIRLAKGYFHERRFLEGRQAVYVALRSHPDSGILIGLAGYAEDHLGNFSEASELYGRAAKLDPGGTGWGSRQEVTLGFDRLLKHDLRGAEEAFRRAVAFNPRSAEAQYGLGVVLKKSGRMSEATDAFQKTLSFAVPEDRWIARARDELALMNKTAK